jgi:hypothetical protein
MFSLFSQQAETFWTALRSNSQTHICLYRIYVPIVNSIDLWYNGIR